jgi:AAA15 family ATPase/GTPase
MINNLEIKNFKSIKHLKIDCKRVNIFIGEPNTGKSNILETIGLFSWMAYYKYHNNLREFVRSECIDDLFYGRDLNNTIQVVADRKILEIRFIHHYSYYEGKCFIEREDKKQKEIIVEFSCNNDFSSMSFNPKIDELLSYLYPFKFYRFITMKNFQTQDSNFLCPPFGTNLLQILKTNGELYKLISELFDNYKLKPFAKNENEIRILEKDSEDINIRHYPYFLTSDTLQRLIFQLTAMEANKDSIITFEEPEAHSFPYYTKYIAERIGLDENNNQYFISTHNPYFLFSVLEKTKKDEIEVFITFLENYQTKVKPLNEEAIKEILQMDIDIFFNIQRFLE